MTKYDRAYAEEVDFGNKDLEATCDMFKDLETLHDIAGSRIRDSRIDFQVAQRLLAHMEAIQREIDACKYLCIKNKIQLICTG